MIWEFGLGYSSESWVMVSSKLTLSSASLLKDAARSGQRGSRQIGRGLPTRAELGVARGLVRSPHPVFALFFRLEQDWVLTSQLWGMTPPETGTLAV